MLYAVKLINMYNLMRHLFFSMDAARMVPIGTDKSIGVRTAIPTTSYLRMIFKILRLCFPIGLN